MLEFFTLVLVSTFLSVNSLGNIPIFMAMLEKYKKSARQSVIRKSVLIAFIVFILFSFFGNYIFQFMHIEIYSFYIAGGIVLSNIALKMLAGKGHETKLSEKEVKMLDKVQKEELENIAITPIAVPMLTGPGSITLGLMLFSSIQFDSINAVVLLGEFLAGAILSYIVSYIVISKSDYFERVLGKMGLKVMSRVMGLLLLSIGVQFVVNGLLKIMALV
ncbi:MAG: MarC family protein [Candidatus Diapherotrites archaeon]